MEQEISFNKDDVLNHLTNLLLGIEQPITEADKKFLENVVEFNRKREEQEDD